MDSETAKKYSLAKTRLFIAGLIVNAVFIILFQVFFSFPMGETLYRSGWNFYVLCFIFVAVFSLASYIVSFPLHFTGAFVTEHRFGLSSQKIGAWLVDELKSSILSFTLFMVCVEVFYIIARFFPVYWWLIAGTGWIFFSIILVRVLPTVFIPIFFKYSALKDKKLASDIAAMADNAGAPLVDVCEINLSSKTKKANAALVGIGSSRRVILADTLVGTFSRDEILAVVAHELGHFRYRHIWKLLLFSGVMTFTGFFILSRSSGLISGFMGAESIFDISLFPFLMFLMYASGILIMPLQNFISRVFERQADRYTLQVTASPEAFISVMEKLAEMNLADRAPSFFKKVFLYDHPPVDERISMARSFPLIRENK